MHLVNLSAPLNVDTLGIDPLKPGQYWAEDSHASTLLWIGQGDASLTQLIPPEAIPLDRLPDGAEITVVRPGGFSEALWLNAIYAVIRSWGRSIRINHATLPRYAPVSLGFVDKIVPYPLRAPAFIDSNRVWWLENVIENSPCLAGEHPCDRLARKFGLEPIPTKARYDITDKEREAAAKRWPRRKSKPSPRVCVQFDSGTPLKSYSHIGRVMAMLQSVGCEILLVGDPGKPLGKVPEGCFYGPGHKLNIRQSIAMASHCDVILSGDSVFAHVGTALDIPVVGIYGPFSGASYHSGRGTYLQGKLPCSPCSWQGRGRPTPPGQPCAQTGRCNAADAIDPREIATAVINLF